MEIGTEKRLLSKHFNWPLSVVVGVNIAAIGFNLAVIPAASGGLWAIAHAAAASISSAVLTRTICSRNLA